MMAQGKALRVHTLEAGDELGWSSVLSGRGKFYQARALEPVETIRFDGYVLLEKCRADNSFGYKIMHRLVGVVSERLQAARMQVLDMYSPIARKAGAVENRGHSPIFRDGRRYIQAASATPNAASAALSHGGSTKNTIETPSVTRHHHDGRDLVR